MTLFDDAEYRTVLEPVPKLSADRKRTVKQAEAIRRGIHPFGLVTPMVVMHPAADRGATSSDRGVLHLRCGSCVHRVLASGGNRDYPKCELVGNSHGPATDCRAWWPACTRYEEQP